MDFLGKMSPGKISLKEKESSLVVRSSGCITQDKKLREAFLLIYILVDTWVSLDIFQKHNILESRSSGTGGADAVDFCPYFGEPCRQKFYV